MTFETSLAARVAACVLAACWADAATAHELSSFHVGNWSGGAYASEATRQFSHCAISADYRNNISLIFGLDRDRGLFLGLSQVGWTLRQDKPVEVGLMVDGAVIGRFVGNPVDAMLLFVDLDHAPGIEEKLREGHTLRIAAAAENLYFELNELSKAFDALHRCVDDSLSTASRTHPE